MLRLFIFILFVGTVVRFVLVGNPGFEADLSFWKSWSLAAIDHGVVWTAHNTNINYPPAFIYVLWAMGKLYSLFADPHNYYQFWSKNNFTFLFASKSFAIASDIAIACLMYWFFSQTEKLKKLGTSKWEVGNVRMENEMGSGKNKNLTSHIYNLASHLSHLTSNLPLLLSSVFFLNPVVFIDSAVWGQVESLGILPTLIAIILIFYKKPVLASFIFTAGALIKLQNIIYIPIFYLFLARYFDLKTVIKSIAAAATTFILLNLPFILANDMNQVLYLLTVNSDYFPWMSLNAHNIWWIASGAAGMQMTDKVTVLGILNAKTVGLFLFAASYLFSCLLIFKRPTPRNFLLALTWGIFSFFLLSTQSHERYSYPVVVLLLFMYPFIVQKKWEVRGERFDNETGSEKFLKSNNQKITLRLLTSHISQLTTPNYFWLVYFLFSLSIFYNIHTGLVYNYPENGFPIFTQLATPFVTLLNSYLSALLLFLLLPYMISQIAPLYFVLCLLFFAASMVLLNSSYLLKGEVSLTKYKPVLMRQDYGSMQVNKSTDSSAGWKKWNRLSNNYFYYRKGFGTHATSNLVFNINNKFSLFTTDYGIDTEAPTSASVIFQIWGDGKLLFESTRLGRFDFPGHARVNVSGVKHLGLVTTDAGDGINSDHADWFNPILYR